MTNLAEELLGTSLGALLDTQDARDLVEKAKSKTVHPGDCLFRTGEPGDALYIILSGTLEVILGQAGANATVVATVGAGQIVGELEVMTKSLRVATLSATAETSVLELPGATLDQMLAENRPAATKIVTYVAKTLARRLAAVNQRIIAKAPKPPPTPEPQSTEPVEISDAEIIPMDDDDLEVLDKLWG